MNYLKLISVSELKTAKDTRAYYTAEFQDATNPFAKSVKRNFWQQLVNGVPAWKGADYAIISKMIDKQFPGAIVTLAVEPYQIDGKDVTSYSTVVFTTELATSVFKSLGHPVASAMPVVQPEPEPAI